MVSDTFETNLIHTEIIRNIYEDEIIICDVSGRNPNVFFELGIRMATQKPTIIIKDDKTIYPFDTSTNRYIQYPRDLRHPLMEKFKTELIAMIGKVKHQTEDQSFIGQIGPFKIPKIESTEVSASEAILQRLNEIERKMTPPETRRVINPAYKFRFHPGAEVKFRNIDIDEVDACIRNIDAAAINDAIETMCQTDWKVSFNVPHILENDHTHVGIAGPDVMTKSFQTAFMKALDDAIPF
ncbi:hypothetical protein CLN94_12910 [Pseudothioclava arenosa]|uniref:Uncharacterized protein n=1 Tax=Pseudothioclava arenosa TaxID=1795308 RepID=A0A2A4CN04_9RHOB|nr:hypothetical protein CLN94_12910 [Pseudothioclava arenosa]